MGPAGWQEVVPERATSSPPRRGHPRPAVRPSRTDRLLAAALAAIPVAAVVLFGGVEPEHALPVEAAALAVGAWAVVFRVRRGERPLPLPAVTLPALLLAAIPALQLLPLPAGLPALLAPGVRRFGMTSLATISVFPQATFLALLRWLAYAAFLIAALEVLRRPGTVATALGVVATLGVVEAAYGVGNLLLGNQHVLWFPRETSTLDATGTFVNRNHYAALFELCVPALLARRVLVGRRDADAVGRAVLGVGAAAAMTVAALLSHSRAGTLCLGLGLGVGVVLTARRDETRTGLRTVAAIACLALAYGSWVGLTPLAVRFAALPTEAAVDRPAVWRDAATMVADFPVAGVGAGAFEAAFPAYRRRSTAQVGWAHAHQDLLELLIEGGPGTLVLVLAAAWAFARRLRLGLIGPPRPERAAAAMLTGSMVALLLHAQVDFPLHIPGLTLLFLLLAAAAATVAARPRPVSRASARAPAA